MSYIDPIDHDIDEPSDIDIEEYQDASYPDSRLREDIDAELEELAISNKEHNDYVSSLQFVADKIDSEGFDYCFTGYSEFEEVEDEEFHRLRRAYVEAANNLSHYVQDNTEEYEEGEEGNEED